MCHLHIIFLLGYQIHYICHLHIIKCNGPKFDPCGTPQVMFSVLDL